MKRWFYILLGGFGLGLASLSVFMFWLGGPVFLSAEAYVVPAEIVAMVSGVLLTMFGFFHGRAAGEFDIRINANRPARRGDPVAGKEIDFRCPTCRKVYRASPMLAGKPFMCRDCDGRFQVPATSDIRALPAPAV